ncbi:MAG: response regulator [Gammaproteobacteria bacterium]|nr:response regulator [Gammaproteobacteria bacterium]
MLLTATQPIAEAAPTCAPDDARVAQERLRLLQRSIAPAYLGSVAVTLLTVGMLWGEIAGFALGAWVAYQLLNTLARAWHTRRCLRQLNQGGGELGVRGLYVGITAAGLGWGATAAFVPLLDAPELRALLPIIAAGVTAGSAAVYALLPRAARGFLLLTLLPVAIAFMLTGRHVDFVIGLMVSCYLLVMLRNAANLDKDLSESLVMRFSMADLADELLASRQKTEGLNRVLREKVAQLESTQQALVTARDAAEAAATAKATFLATMSHEIRTPMNGVLGMSELLLGTPLSKRQTQLADTIHRSGRQLLGVINDVLDFSNVEAGKLDIAAVPFHLRDLVDDLGEMFAEPAHRAGIELACGVPNDLHTVLRGDPDRLRQVLTNLVSNAVKFTEHGEVVIRVSAEGAAGGARLLRFEVRDSGIGIAPEHQARIFDSFAQADGSTTRKFGGTGLGLAISRRLVELMGGEIGLDSTPGRGSTFWFTCPVTTAEAGELGTRARPASRRAAITGMSVLVVGRDDTSRALLVDQVGAWGARVDAVDGGQRALQALRRAAAGAEPYTVMLFARELGDMNAPELARAVRGDAAIAGTRMVMLTTVANLESTGELLAGGVSAYLTRPVRQRELFAAISGGAAALAAAESEAPRASGYYQARVLVVEDNNVNQQLAKSMLESLGCEVRVVDNGQEALEAVTESPLDALREPYDIVLMDCQMPVLDGYAATRAIRTWEREQGETPIPIVALTANALEGDRERCLEAGMDDYLAKPFTREEINQLLANWLPEAPSTPAAATPAASPSSAPRATATVQPSGASPLDEAALARITALQRDGSPDLLGHLIGLFLGNTARLIADVEEGAAAGDADRVRRAVHTLKSSSANLGATTLSKLCAELERFARDGQVEETAKRLDVLHFELDGVIAALRALRPGAAA